MDKMFSNEQRLNHLKQLYLYLLKYNNEEPRRYGVYQVININESYVVHMAVRNKAYGFIPMHLTYVLSPLPEE